MKLLILSVLAVAAFAAVPQIKSEAECMICHFLAPVIEEAAEKEVGQEEAWVLKECTKLPHIFANPCESLVHEYLDELIDLLRKDEAASGKEACNIVFHC
uniref:Saposin B-type domain-containing protein n=1 Tax=Plectus sambesii TaxID=2011161 RepID=A0A914UN53_9BILA